MTQMRLQEHPFVGARVAEHVAPAGLTIAEMIAHAAGGVGTTDALHVVVHRNGHSHEVPAALWDKLRPKEGTEILVTRMPEDGGTLRSIAMIAVMAAAMWVTQGGAAAGGWFQAGTMSANLLAGTVGLVGTLAVNAAFPPPTPGGGMGSQGQKWNALTSTGNALNPDGAIPTVYGSARWFPPHAAAPYQEPQGRNLYHRYMFDLGYLTPGALNSDIRIGATPVDDFDDVEYEITTSPTLYVGDPTETVVGVTLANGDEATRTTTGVCDEVGVDILFNGLFGVNNKGKHNKGLVFFTIEHRLAGSSDAWVMPGSDDKLTMTMMSKTAKADRATHPFYVWENTPDAFTASARWKAPTPGEQYEVRVKRWISEWGDFDDAKVGEECIWTVLRSVRAANPSTTGTTKLCMRIKASDQLTGQLQTLSIHTAQAVPVYDEATDTWTDTVTDNTAWVVYWLMTAGPSLKKHVPASRMDLPAWLDYAEFCEANNLTTHSVLDTDTTAGAYVKDLLANSMARPSYGLTGKYTVLFDDGTRTADGAFTTLESGNLCWTRTFVRRPHALRVRFRNPDADWDWDTIIVLDDGYSLNGVDARGNPSSDPEPALFEELELRHAAYAQQAWQVARLALGQGRYQQAVATFDTDISGIRYTRGDVVKVENDVMEWGAGSGWITSVDGTTIKLDRQVATTAGLTYSAQVRRVDASGNQVLGVYTVTPHSVLTDTFYFDEAPTAAVGDTVIIGETDREAPTLLLTNRSSADDKHFGFTAVAYDSRVAAYWANPPATITSAITGKRYLEAPDAPEVVAIVSDEVHDTRDDAGVARSRVGFHLKERWAPIGAGTTDYYERQRG